MRTQLEKLSPVLVELQVEVPASTVTSQVSQAYDDLRKRARVRGFRPGKAPRHVLAHLYGAAIQADVAKKLVETSLPNALKVENVQPLTQPDVQHADMQPGSDFSFKARFEVRPEIEAVRWEGLEAKRPTTDVTDDQVKEELEQLQRQHSTLQPVEDREARKGDTASLALTVDLGGETLSEEAEVELGGGQLLAAIEQGTIGMKVGEQKTVESTFPAGHPNPKVRGKQASFAITLRELKERLLPALDDELAKDCGEFENLAALEAHVRADVQKRNDQKAQEDVARQLVMELCKANPIPVPPSLVQQQARLEEQELVQVGRMTGRPFQPDDQMKQRLRAEAEMKVRAGLLMAEIAKAKKMTVSEEDIEKGYTELAEQTGKNLAKVKAEYADRGRREQLVGMILEDKILDLTEGAAKIVPA